MEEELTAGYEKETRTQAGYKDKRQTKKPERLM